MGKKIYIAIKRTISILISAAVIAFVIVGGVVTYKNYDPFYETNGVVTIFGKDIQLPEWSYNYVTTDFMGYQPHVILSDSMKPTFSAGDGIIAHVLTDEEKQNVKVGDIVSYTIGNPKDRVFVIHRVDALDEDTGKIIFKGDNNNMIDAVGVDYSQLSSVYLFKIPGFGFFINFAKKPVGILLILAATMLVIWAWGFLWDVLDYYILGYIESEENEKKDDEDENEKEESSTPSEEPESTEETPDKTLTIDEVLDDTRNYTPVENLEDIKHEGEEE